MALNTRLQVITRRAEEECLWLAALLSDEEKTQKGTARQWSARDTIAHIAHWYGVMAADLAGPRDRPAVDYGDFTKINDQIFHEHESQEWSEIMALLNHSIDSIVGSLEHLSTKELMDPEAFKWTNGQPLWRWLAGIGYNHTTGHLGELYRSRGQAEHCVHLMKRSMHLLNDLIDEPTWHAVNNYNIACAYSLSGQVEKALPFLKTAFREDPKLKDWAKQDPDLVSLQKLDGFKSLYT
ncbi:MAG: ClbS/DfsB family four-helix bundle protein [Anaerolineaceae bacterium]|nr:ClbS/DfsB family four-helix bundle protein [Anaerolineaceae bacterium]MBN2677763.1 ClbS/DfsB family four-helix bundle protein [Anaerolineaceae bacterium]